MRKKIWLAVSFSVIFIGVLFAASCTKKMVQTQPPMPTEAEVHKAPVRSVEATRQDDRLMKRLMEEAAAREADKMSLVSEDIHFAFDSSDLSGRARQILNSKADYLRINPDITITVEGHCDDRGTDAYNIRLGKQRAESVKGFLVSLGIRPKRLTTVSYGEKRPVASGHNEKSWAMNRRAGFAIN